MTGPTMFNDPPVRTQAMLALFRTVQRRLLLLTAVAAVLGVIVGLLVAQLPGVWGALLASALGLVFMLTTVAALRFVAGRGPEVLQLVLIGGWIVKIVLVVLALLWLREQEFYDRGVFFGTLVVVVLGGVLVEIGSVATARLPYVEVPLPASTDVSDVTRPAADRPPGAPPTPEPQDRTADALAEPAPDGVVTPDPGGPARPDQGPSSGRV